MLLATDLLREEHRAVERRVDALLAAIAENTAIGERFRSASEAAITHYLREASFFETLRRYDAPLADKMMAQHGEALEIAEKMLRSPDDDAREAIYLARRFCAIAQHNIIEEERDVFPAANRCFGEAEQETLRRSLTGSPGHNAGLDQPTPHGPS